MSLDHNPGIQYRPEIDGLRAAAVVPVIFFHAGFKFFSGGYIGVDVFFVISGYLITSIILRDLEQGRFSVINFYERRARRILPALFVVIACCMPLAWLWMLPDELVRFGQSLAAVATFSSNLYFWQKTDYFAPAAEEQPLLHTWSLAVEEQYYLVFPIALMLIFRLGRSKLFWITAMVALASLALSEWGWRHRSAANFYLLPTRAWELLAGSLLAFPSSTVLRRIGDRPRVGQLGALLGLALLLGSILLFDDTTPAPSLYTGMPVLGTMLVILFANHQNLVGRLLSSKAFVGIGLISYSAYLWHQPIFALTRVHSPDKPGTALMLGLALLVFPLAWFSWRFVEKPFRSSRFSRRKIFEFSAAALASGMLIGAVIHFYQGFESRINLPSEVIYSMQRAAAPCFDKPGAHQDAGWLCPVDDSRPRSSDYLLIGDSHMYSMIPGFKVAQRLAGKQGHYAGFSGCPPLLGIYALRSDQALMDCHQLNQRIFTTVKERGISTIVLVARWTYYTDGGYDGDNYSFIGMAASHKGSPQESYEAFKTGLRQTIQAYDEIGVKVIVIAQIPQQRHDPKRLYFSAFQGANPLATLTDYSVSITDHTKLQARVNQEFSKLSARFPDTLVFADFSSNVCDRNRCPTGTSSASYYFDRDHLSVTGAERLGPAIAQLLGKPPG